jgi:hypothetical protein
MVFYHNNRWMGKTELDIGQRMTKSEAAERPLLPLLQKGFWMKQEKDG